MNDRNFTHASFHQYLTEQTLMGARCGKCGMLHLPPRPICAGCHSDEMVWDELSGAGKLLGFTSIYTAPTAMLEAGYSREKPYCTGVVELAEGPAISAQILGVDAAHPEQIRIGIPLHVTFVERGAGEDRKTYLAFETTSPVEA